MGEWKKTQCAMCVLSCGLEMEVENDKIVNVRPDKESVRSHGYCCRKGRTAKYYQDNPDRIDYPLKKVGDHFEKITWDQAIKEISQKANRIIKEHGARSVACIGGALTSAQAELVYARSLMSAIGSQYFYNAIGIEFMGSWWSHGKIFGNQMYFLEPDDDNCEVLMFWGSNSYVLGQILNAREKIRSASQDTKRMVIAVDPRLSETARMADMHIMLRPGSDSLMLRGMIALILEKGWQDQKYIDKYVKDFEKIKSWFTNFDYKEAFRVSGVSCKQMEEFCKILTTKKWGVHQDLGVFMGRHNTMNCYLLLMLEVLCGVAFMPGGCIVPECAVTRGDSSDENNPNTWRTVETNRFPVLGTYPSAVVPQEILSKKKDRLRLIFCSSSNPVKSYPNSNDMEKALKQLDLLVCIDICMSETGRLADYVLPSKSVYERADMNAFQYNYPEICAHIRKPVIEKQIGERKDPTQIWIDLTKEMGYLPKLPDNLYKKAKKSVEEKDRIPYFLSLLKYAALHKKHFPMLPIIVGETLGRYMDSPASSLYWVAMMISPISGKGMVEKAGIKPSGKHKIFENLPVFKDFCLMDAAFQLVDEHPEGAVIGISDPETMIDRHIAHKDKKIHLYCDEINEYIQNITPKKEEKELMLNDEYPMVLSSGSHSDNGVNWIMRNANMTKYRRFYTASINPDDAMKLGIKDGDKVRVTTKADSIILPAKLSWNTSRGYVVIPHHFGFIYQGKQYGESTNKLVPENHMDEITGNPLLRYVPCQIELAKEK